MSNKKVTVPKSFDPGGGRPREHLAYLNYQEMEALRRLNGEGPYKSPFGPPSFVLGGFGSAGAGTYSTTGGSQLKSSTTGARGTSGGSGAVTRTSAGGFDASRAGGGDGRAIQNAAAASAQKAAQSGGALQDIINGGLSTLGSLFGGKSSAGLAAAPAGLSKPIKATPSFSQMFDAPKPYVPKPVPRPTTQAQHNYSGLLSTVPSRNELIAKIKQEAVARGIDPDVALTVAKKEGLYAHPEEGWQSFVKKNGVRETSYGPYQLRVGGGLGDEFIKTTGLDPRDPRSVNAQIEFALDKAAEKGWGAWYGARAAGFSKRTGLESAKPLNGTGVARSVAAPAPELYNRTLGGFKSLSEAGRPVAAQQAVAQMSAPSLPRPPKAEQGYSIKPGQIPADAMSGIVSILNNPGSIPQVAKAGNWRAASDPKRLDELRSKIEALKESGVAVTPDGKNISIPGSAATKAQEVFNKVAEAYTMFPGMAPGYGKNFENGLSSVTTKTSIPPSKEAIDAFNMKASDYLDAARGLAMSPSLRSAPQVASSGQPTPSGTYWASTGLTKEQQAKVDAKLTNQKRAEQAAGMMTGLPLGLAGGFLNDYTANKIDKYAKASVTERRQMELDDPSLIGWAKAAGITPINDQSVYNDWAARSGLRGIVNERSRDSGVPGETASNQSSGGSAAEDSFRARPYQYYLWDLGSNIPSPGDPAYTDYQKYLAELKASLSTGDI